MRATSRNLNGMKSGIARTRRHFLHDCQVGLGAIALSALLRNESSGSMSPHSVPRAKNVIFLHMAGSPPHLDLFDFKPELVDLLMKLRENAQMGDGGEMSPVPLTPEQTSVLPLGSRCAPEMSIEKNSCFLGAT